MAISIELSANFRNEVLGLEHLAVASLLALDAKKVSEERRQEGVLVAKPDLTTSAATNRDQPQLANLFEGDPILLQSA